MTAQTSSTIDTSFLDLPGVFQALASSQRTGVLVVRSQDQTRGIRFESGSVRMVVDLANPRFLLDALVRSRQVAPQQVQGLRLMPALPVSEQLINAGLATAESLAAAFSFHIMESACDVFAWTDVTCEFVHGEPAAPWIGLDFDWPGRVNPTALGMEAGRRLDEGNAIAEALPSLADIPVAAPGIQTQTEDTVRDLVVGLVDGQRDVYDILEIAPMGRFEARLIVAELLRSGELTLASKEQMLEVARSLMKSESGLYTADHKTKKLIRLYERVEERGYSNVQLAIWLGRAYELAGRVADAITRYIAVCTPLMQQKRSREAVEIIARAINLDPGNARLRELLVEAYLLDKENEQAAEIAIGILRNLRASGATEEATQLAEAMRKADPANLRVLEHLAELHLEAGDRTSAILELEELAGMQLDLGEQAAAAVTFERVIELDYYHLMAHFRLAQTLHALARTDEAVKRYKQLADMLSSTEMGGSINWQFLIRTYENIAEIEVDNILAKEWLVRTYLEQGKQAEALKHLQGIVAVLRGQPANDSLKGALLKLVELRPGDLSIRKMLADVHQKRGERDRAVTELITLAELALTINKVPQAQQALDTAATIDPHRLDVHQAYADLYTELGLVREAACKLRDVGYLQRASNQLDSAESSFRQAIAVDPHARLCLLELAGSRADRGDPAAASRLYQEVAEWAAAQGEAGYLRLALDLAHRLEGADLAWAAALAPSSSAPARGGEGARR